MEQAPAKHEAHNPRSISRSGILSFDWRGGARWFAAEFLVVVTGILVAFSLQAWWAGRLDMRRENAFLSQLLADARENERRIEVAIAVDSANEASLARLTAALRSPQQLPPDDSLLAWLRVSSSAFRPVLGTIGMVRQTDGVQLVRVDSVRTRIVAYAGDTEAILEQLRTLEGAVLASGPQLYARVERHIADSGQPHFAGMKGDTELRAALRYQRILSFNRAVELRHLRDQTHLFIRILERALAPG
jgi:hypothetical protein